MANLIKRTHGDQPSTQSHPREWEPMRLLRDLVRWDPFHEAAPFQAVMPTFERDFVPAFEVAEHTDRFVIQADLPGVSERDIEINITGNRLTVSGKRESEHEEKAESYYACERSYGTFTRSFTLPIEQADLDHVSARLEDGVLAINVPKHQTSQSRKVAIEASGKQPSSSGNGNKPKA